MRSVLGSKQTLGLAAWWLCTRDSKDDPWWSTRFHKYPKGYGYEGYVVLAPTRTSFSLLPSTYTRLPDWRGMDRPMIPSLWFWFTLAGNYTWNYMKSCQHMSCPLRALRGWADDARMSWTTTPRSCSSVAFRTHLAAFRLGPWRYLRRSYVEYVEHVECDGMWMWPIVCHWLLQTSADLSFPSFPWYVFRGPLAMWQVVVPENMDMKDKFSLTQAALYWPFSPFLNVEACGYLWQVSCGVEDSPDSSVRTAAIPDPTFWTHMTMLGECKSVFHARLKGAELRWHEGMSGQDESEKRISSQWARSEVSNQASLLHCCRSQLLSAGFAVFAQGRLFAAMGRTPAAQKKHADL